MVKASVIVPAYNEEKDISDTVRRIKRVSKEYEVIVVDDGSSDRTKEKAAEAGATVISHPENRGKGAAMRTGASHAKGRFLVFIDASQFHPEQIPLLLEKAGSGTLVVGKRPFRVMHFGRRINNILSILSLFLATGRLARDVLSGFFVISKKDWNSLGLKQDRFQIEAEMNYKALSKGMKIVYVPVKVDYPPGLGLHRQFTNIKQVLSQVTFLSRLVLQSWAKPFKILSLKKR